ncbi:MAG TPA: DUF4249 domain-containing protein [Lentimicrobium sp.]|nr:DUF4249 domain-containing protein [Lentimicrobium sp.]
MLQIKTISLPALLLFNGLLLCSCIKEYDPQIKSSDQSNYVVMGHITDDGGMQTVNVSLSSPSENPEYIPMDGCNVTVSDNHGNRFLFESTGKGNYTGNIQPAFFEQGTLFMVRVITPAGDTILSDYDRYYQVPAVDSVYYTREDIESNTIGVFTKGIRFYVNLDAKGYTARNFMWEAVETYEYHVAYPIEWYYDGQVHHIWPPDSSKLVCWMTKQIPYIFTLSTKNLTENEYNRFPLQFVDNRTNRLLIGYSLLVRQYSLSDSAYRYWDEMRINSVEQGGLFTKQPLSVKGNLHIAGKPGERVLGAFTVSSVQSKRIFVQNVENLPIEIESTCNPAPLRRGLREISPYDYPAYLLGDQFGYSLVVLNENCVNCMIAGGINVKPDFWPW